MASDQNKTGLTTRAPRHAGVKRSLAQESQPPRKSARLEKQHPGESIPTSNCRQVIYHGSGSSIPGEEKSTQQRHESNPRKRPRTQNDSVTPEEHAEDCCKRRRVAEENTSVPTSLDNLSADEQHPIAYWATNQRWPPQCFEIGNDMENILARKRSVSARSKKNSDTDSATPSSTNYEPKSREEKSADYKKPQYETVLATKGFSTKPSPRGVTAASKDWCKVLLEEEKDFKYPEDTLFRDDLFGSTCETIRNKNETRVIRDIALLIVPSAEIFAIRGAAPLECLIDSVNEGWNNSIPITKTRPQPDYAVGFRREAFKQEQLDRMHPIIGDFNDVSFFMATWYMYFPFLTCEVKCGAAALDIADRQNAHSAAIAVRAVVELFRAVKREKELHREILAFSISHDDHNVRIYGYYAEIADSGTKYYRYPIRNFIFVELDGREKWTAYRFTKNVYDNWMPMHFKRICSAIDQIPAHISFSVSQSEVRFPETTSGLSQDLSAYDIAQSSVASTSGSGHARDDTQSSIDREPVATPRTSVTDREPKKQRRETAG